MPIYDHTVRYLVQPPLAIQAGPLVETVELSTSILCKLLGDDDQTVNNNMLALFEAPSSMTNVTRDVGWVMTDNPAFPFTTSSTIALRDLWGKELPQYPTRAEMRAGALELITQKKFPGFLYLHSNEYKTLAVCMQILQHYVAQGYGGYFRVTGAKFAATLHVGTWDAVSFFERGAARQSLLLSWEGDPSNPPTRIAQLIACCQELGLPTIPPT